ncbi:MAG: hypothetical protein V1663_00345 [archaeon]
MSQLKEILDAFRFSNLSILEKVTINEDKRGVSILELKPIGVWEERQHMRFV